MNALERDLWTFEELARLIAGLSPDKGVVAALPPPTAALLARGVAADSAIEIDFLLPEWTRDLIVGPSGVGEMRGSWEQSLPSNPPTFVAAANSDEVVLQGPLSRFYCGGADRQVAIRLRTLDWLAADRASCAILIVGSGRHVPELIEGAALLLEKHRPIVVADLSSLRPSHYNAAVSDTQARESSRYDLLSRLDGYVQVEPVGFPVQGAGHRKGARFLIAAPDGNLASSRSSMESSDAREATVGDECAQPAISWPASDITIVANGVYDRRIDRIRWLGNIAGLYLMIEAPAATVTVECLLHARIRNGLRVIVNGRTASHRIETAFLSGSIPEDEPTLQRARRTRVFVQLDRELSEPQLMLIQLVAIRLATTEQPEPLEVERIDLHDRSESSDLC